MFTDVMEDFHRLHIIKTRFEQWKWGYSNGYQQAFVSMCLPKLFAPFVSLQLIDWNPLLVQLILHGPSFYILLQPSKISLSKL